MNGTRRQFSCCSCSLATATAFAVTQHLKLEPSPISQTHVDKTFSPACNCATNAAHIDFSIRRADHLRIVVRTPSGPDVIADSDFPKGTVHVRWDGHGVPDGVYHAVVHMQRAAAHDRPAEPDPRRHGQADDRAGEHDA